MPSLWFLRKVWSGLGCFPVLLFLALPASADEFFGDELSPRERYDTETSLEEIESGIDALSVLEIVMKYQAFAEGRCEGYFEVEAAAKNGDGPSQHMLSDLYRRGYCVQQDDERSLYWARQAATGGYEPAFFDFGFFLAEGIGTRKNPAAAVPWLEKATATRMEAYFFLAQIYLSGEGVVQNYRKAHDYALKGAQLGDPLAQAMTAVLKGQSGFEFTDRAAAYKWALIARSSGRPKIIGALATLVAELEGALTQQQVARIQNEAFEWKPRKPPQQASADPTAVELPVPALESVASLSRGQANARLQELGLERDRFLFFKAIAEDNVGVVALYVRAGASVETVSPVLYHPPLLYAAVIGSEQVARYLISAGADIDRWVNDGEDTAILLALSRGHRELAEFLIEQGARLDHPGIMYSAVKFDDPDFLAMLKSKGVPIDQDYVGTPLSEAVSSVDENGESHCYERSAAYLIAEGARLDVLDTSGENLLRQAITTKNPVGCVRLLLEQGVSQDAPQGREPLFLAVMSGNVELARLLLEYGANPEVSLELPADQVPFILEGEAKSTVMNGGTLLQLAVVEQHAAIARLLVQHGAGKDTADNLGRTPLSMAEKTGDSLMIAVLKGEM